MVIKKAPLPYDIRKLGVDGVNQIWRDARLRGAGIKRARTLVTAAEHSIGSTGAPVSARIEIRNLLDDYEVYKNRMDDLMQEIEAKLSEIPYIDKLMGIRGIGIKTVSCFTAEVGDIRRFDNPKQLQKLAGYSIVADSSGKHKGESRISHRGRKRLRYTLYEAAISVNLWTALGTNATPISFTELYTSLQQGVVDAQENPISLINSSKFYEQQKYVINTNHQVMPIFWICNLDWYNSLPDEYKAYFDEGCKILTDYHASECEAEEAAFLQNWIEGGIEYIELTDEARAEMKEAALTVWPAIAEKYPEAYQKLQECLERVGAA